MALRAVALVALLAPAGCERLPAGHGEIIWERELDAISSDLAGAADGDLFLGVGGELSRLAPTGEVR